MPSSIIIAVVADMIITELVIELFIFKLLTYAVVGAVVRSAFGGKPNKPQYSDPTINSKNRTVTVRQPVTAWQIIYGRARVGGAITYIYSSGDKLEMVITLAGHVCQEIEEIYFNDELIPLDGSGNATGTYAGYVSVIKSLGAEAGQPFSGLVTASGGEWTDAHRQSGRTKIWVSLTANRDLFPSGVPNITAVVKGRKIPDSRISPTADAYSANAALCVHDYLTDSEFGFGAVAAEEIDADQLIAAANSCDEQVAKVGSPTEYESRYACNGAFFADSRPQDVIGLLLSSMQGKAVNVGGKWFIFAGVYEVPTITLDEDDLVGPIRVQSLVSRRDNANGVKGLFTDPNASWQPTSFPAIDSDGYMAEDGGERIRKDLDLSPFVTSGSQAQRIAKIELLSLRQGLSAKASFRISALAAMTGRTVALSNVKFGWSAKAFEVIEMRFVAADDGTLAVELTLRETASAVFDWATSEEQAVDLAPNSTLPDAFGGLTISGLTATSGTADILRQGDGTVVPRVRLRWTAPSNPFLKEYEIETDRSSASPTEWVPAPKVAAPATEGFGFPVVDGETCNLRIRAVTVIGTRGAWAYLYGHSVIGKTAAPSDVTGATAIQSGGLVIMGCNAVEDADLDAIEVRLQDEGQTSWEDGTPAANILRGQTVTSAALPPGTFNLLFKARDTSGNYSANAQAVEIVVTSDGYTAITSSPQAGAWLGPVENMVKHWTGVLTPESQSLASALTDAELWDQFVANAFTNCYYTAPEIDKSTESVARIYGDVVSVLGPGETAGTAAPVLQVDSKTTLGSYDGYLNWSVGSESFRYMLARIHVDTTLGKPVISQFTPTVDALSRIESGTLTVLEGSPSEGKGSVTFASPFHNAPVLQVSPQGSGAVSASYASLSSTGFEGYFKTNNLPTAGTMSYSAEGA